MNAVQKEKLSHSPSWAGGSHRYHFENFHILLWLIKDTCWLLEWRTAGTIMIVPTILVAIFIMFKSASKNIFWVNLAICFWISSNCYWMLCEFFSREELKIHAIYSFIAGMISVTIFFIRQLTAKKNSVS
mgnify:FL=1